MRLVIALVLGLLPSAASTIAPAYAYDLPTIAGHGVQAIDAAVAAQPRLADAQEGPASPRVTAEGASTTQLARSVATNTAYRGPSQSAPGGQAGPAVSLDQVKQCLGRCGMSVSKYDISHTPVIDSPAGSAFGRTSIVNGKPVIEISDMGLSSMDEAVTTIFHETHHVNSFRAFGHTGSEFAAETYGQRMLGVFQRRAR